MDVAGRCPVGGSEGEERRPKIKVKAEASLLESSDNRIDPADVKREVKTEPDFYEGETAERLFIGTGIYGYDDDKDEVDVKDEKLVDTGQHLEPSDLVEVKYGDAHHEDDSTHSEDGSEPEQAAREVNTASKTDFGCDNAEEGMYRPLSDTFPHLLHHQLTAGASDGRLGAAESPCQPSTSTQVAEERNFHCEECGKQFTLKSSLTRHLVAHTGVRKFECHDCGKRFTNKYFLKEHMVIHTGAKNFKCEECGKCFTQKGTLNHHRVTHTGVMKFKCQFCHMLFLRKDTFNRHTMAHTGVANFKCRECGKLFMQRSHLKKHMVTHTGEKKYRCEQCGKCFTQSGNLNTHRMTHAGIKKFKCETCGKLFTQKMCLNRHMSTHSS